LEVVGVAGHADAQDVAVHVMYPGELVAALAALVERLVDDHGCYLLEVVGGWGVVEDRGGVVGGRCPCSRVWRRLRAST
jgi:hypothetical protein